MRESIFREPSSLLSFSHHRFFFLNYFLHCSQYSHNFLQFRVMLPQDFDQSPLPQSLNAQSSRFHWIGHNKLWFHKYLVTNSFLPDSGTRWSNFPGLQSATEQVVGAGGRLGVCLPESERPPGHFRVWAPELVASSSRSRLWGRRHIWPHACQDTCEYQPTNHPQPPPHPNPI